MPHHLSTKYPSWAWQCYWRAVIYQWRTAWLVPIKEKWFYIILVIDCLTNILGELQVDIFNYLITFKGVTSWITRSDRHSFFFVTRDTSSEIFEVTIIRRLVCLVKRMLTSGVSVGWSPRIPPTNFLFLIKSFNFRYTSLASLVFSHWCRFNIVPN